VWSTLRRMIIVVGVLVGVLLVAMVWITMLRRQVEQRTAQLRVEIQERERAEKMRAIEEERSRIARDLHDDLGSSLTEISLLADAGLGNPPLAERALNRFRAIGAKARALVQALDVIVWLVNPSKDALPFLAGYLGSYAEEYLGASGVGCRLKIPMDMPALRLNAEVRHNLFLAVKEALHNIVRHAHASEVLVTFALREGVLEIAIADNGQGFDPTASVEGNGLANLRQRVAGIGGRCEIQAQPGGGASVRLVLPLPADPHAA
jgi:signal transduction histidine kinase